MKIKSYTKIAQVCTFLGAICGFLYCYFNLYNIENIADYMQQKGWNLLWKDLIGMVLSGIILLLAAKPNNPLPFGCLPLLIAGFLLLVVAYLWGGVLVMISGILMVFDKPEGNRDKSE